MSSRLVTRVVLIALWALTMVVYPAYADEVPIDDFSHANLTGMLTQVDDTSGPTPVNSTLDTGLVGVIGGSRKITVSAVGPISMGLAVGAQVFTALNPGLTPGLCANSTNDKTGQVDLLYDANGAGLNADFSPFSGIRVIPNVVDVGVGTELLSYKLTLVDQANHMASASITQGTSCFEDCVEHRFLFRDFSAVNLRNIKSVTLSIASTNAFDVIIGPLTLFGNTETAPVLSANMIMALVLMLGAVGLVGMFRTKRTN